jgi:D-alanyl-lipoteichoic acid acyltransferase DltB (MBOAT superfamily)
MSWQPIYGCLILFATAVSWLTAIGFEKKTGRKKILLISCLVICFGILFIFKYANFISASINNLFTGLHIQMQIPFLNVLLPVGISFYTFQIVGYVIDVYKGNIRAEKNFYIYALFVSFFPQLVAGPIERAGNLLPQFHRVHRFDTSNLTKGLRLVLWGYFMKVVVSDRLSIYVESVYSNVPHHNGTSLLLATFFFAFQIYCDFGGYSNIAIGCAKIMGFDLMTNFRRPYLATSVVDFWRRWHISLSTWFKDYLYIPLGGNRCGKYRNYYNLLVTFIVSGIWHGANWTFIIWGALNGIFQVIEKMFAGTKKKSSKLIYLTNILITFVLVSMTWVFFRANSVADSFLILKKIAIDHGMIFINTIGTMIYGVLGILMLIISDIFQEKNNGVHYFLENRRPLVRSISYIVICLIILAFGVFDTSQFIYFQF